MHPIASAQEFDSIIASNKTVFVDFYADWCGPCRMMAPVLEQWESVYPNVKFVKVNVDTLPQLAQRFSVTGMPTFVALTSGSEVERIVGADRTKVQSVLQKLN